MKLVEAVAGDVTVLEAYGRIDSTTSKVFGGPVDLTYTKPILARF